MDQRLCIIFIVALLVPTILACSDQNLKKYGRCEGVGSSCEAHDDCCCPNQCMPVGLEENGICTFIGRLHKSGFDDNYIRANRYDRIIGPVPTRRTPNYRDQPEDREPPNYRDDRNQPNERYQPNDSNQPNERYQPDVGNQPDGGIQPEKVIVQAVPLDSPSYKPDEPVVSIPEDEMYSMQACLFPNKKFTNGQNLALCTALNQTAPKITM